MDDAVTVVLVGLEAALAEELSDDERFDVRSAATVDELGADESLDAVVVALDGQGPLELLGSLRSKAPDVAVVVVTEAGREADGAVAMHAGAEDHLDPRRDPARAVASSRALRGFGPPAPPRADHDRRGHRSAEPARIRADRRAPPPNGRSQPVTSGVPVRAARRYRRGRGGSRGGRRAARRRARRRSPGTDHRPTRSRCCSRETRRGPRSIVLSRSGRGDRGAQRQAGPPSAVVRYRSEARCTTRGLRRPCRRSSRPRGADCTTGWRADPSDRRRAANTG